MWDILMEIESTNLRLVYCNELQMKDKRVMGLLLRK